MPEKVVVVTGANNGIGLALTKSLHSTSYRVVGLDLSGENLAGIKHLRCDVTDETQVQTTVATILEEWGQIDILVNNACLAIYAPFETKKLEDTRREFEVNYFGYINLIRAVLPQMKDRRSGIIHNFSSTVGLSGFGGIYGYASTKGAIEALSRTLAIELAPYGITVNIVHPPLTRTPSSAPLGIPEQFMADPADVGRKLAKKIGSTQAVITPGITESIGVFMVRLIPGTMGKFLSSRAEAVRQEAVSTTDGA